MSQSVLRPSSARLCGCLALSSALASAGGAAPATAGLEPPVALRCEYLVRPLAVESASPRLSWELRSAERGVRQAAYRVLVAADAATLAQDRGDLWDSGRVESDATAQVAYGGKPLASGQACAWKVRWWDAAGNASPWSEPSSWAAGLLKPEDWKAGWISFRDPSAVHSNRAALFLPPARHYRRAFEASRPVRRATAYVSALGIYELHVNGRRAADERMSPGWADYARRALYRAHDVTAQLRAGTNTIGAIVADGWYAGYVGYGLLVGYGPYKTGRGFYGKTPALRLQLEIEYADGGRETVATGPGWQVSGDGPIREADLIMGEAFDARRDRPDWCTPAGAADWTWEAAIPAADNGPAKARYFDTLGEREIDLGFRAPPRMQAHPGPAVRTFEELPARRVTEPQPGRYVFDLGQNFSGVVRLRVRGPAGTKVQIRHGEMVHPDGRLMTENLRKARATDFYTLRGDPAGETWTPSFTYHGFQYVELSGLPEKPGLDAVTGIVLHSDTPPAGEFACSDEGLTRFWRNTWWTQRSNFVELPTDCPQRDERLGWMGDAQIYAGTACYNADVAAFYTKWMDDVEEAQRDFGAYPDYCPYPMAHGKPGATHGTAWTDAGILVPWTVWQAYGDTRILERHWASMERFMAWRAKADPDLKGVSIGNTWGDWLNVNEATPIEYIDLAYHALDARRMLEMAGAIGRADAAAAYRERLARLLEAFRTRHLEPAGNAFVPKVRTQTACVLALDFGLLPDAASVEATSARLADRIASNGFRMATGFLGTKPLLPALTRAGRHDLAVRLFQSRQFPSWGYEVEQGATTVWERWDSYTKEHGFNGASGNQNASMNSFSHYSFGAVAEWMFRDLAGIASDGPGYRRIVIRPGVPSPSGNPDRAPVSWARAAYRSIRGPIVSDWKRDGDRLALRVEIPPNTLATVLLPAADAADITEGGRPLAAAQGVRLARTEAGLAVLEVGSGRYEFMSRIAPR